MRLLAGTGGGDPGVAWGVDLRSQQVPVRVGSLHRVGGCSSAGETEARGGGCRPEQPGLDLIPPPPRGVRGLLLQWGVRCPMAPQPGKVG